MKVVIEVTAYGDTGRSNVNDLAEAVVEEITRTCGRVVVYRDYEQSDILTLESVSILQTEGTL
jgi:hypothetical protein